MSANKKKPTDTVTTSPILPLKVRLLFALHSLGVDLSRQFTGRRCPTVNRTILKLFDLKSPPPSSTKPYKGVTTFDVKIDPTRTLWFRLYRPAPNTLKPLPVIVYFHGGGFMSMGADSKFYDLFCRSMARETPAVVVSVNYRLAPEHRCPRQYEDGFDALKFVDGRIVNFWEEYNVDVDFGRCFLAGDSAGGNLAHHVAVRGKDDELKHLKITGLIAIQPFFGGEERTESEMKVVGVPIIRQDLTDWAWKAFLPEGSNRDHPAANVSGPNGVDISGLVRFPPTMVVVGGFDPLQDWQRRYIKWLKKSGKTVELLEVPSAVHAFYTMADLPETSLLLTSIKDFVQAQSHVRD
ncbi:Probable carboxylesterase 18 [Linum perenne]